MDSSKAKRRARQAHVVDGSSNCHEGWPGTAPGEKESGFSQKSAGFV
jgi:hypothetical protein